MRKLNGFILATLLVLIIFIIGGCTPITPPQTSSLKSRTTVSANSSNTSSELAMEKYLIKNDPYSGLTYKTLQTLGKWDGEGDKNIIVNYNKSPWIVNYEYVKTSDILSEISVIVAIKSEFDRRNGYTLSDLFQGQWIWGPQGVGTMYIIVPKTGDFVISIQSSGMNWTLKTGIER